MARKHKIESLTSALKARGISHQRDTHTDGDGRHAWFDRDGILIGRFDAHEGWSVIRGEISLNAEAA